MKIWTNNFELNKQPRVNLRSLLEVSLSPTKPEEKNGDKVVEGGSLLAICDLINSLEFLYHPIVFKSDQKVTFCSN